MSTQRVKVARLWDETPEIRCFELAPITHSPERFEAGAHIDLHLPNGCVRQYSLWNGPEDRAGYFIGVKREAAGRGGSAAMHGLALGDELEVSAPKNHFPLQPSVGTALLIAGGIGLTPILSMARQLWSEGRAFSLHVFTRDRANTPFYDQLAPHPETQFHMGVAPSDVPDALRAILTSPDRGADLYFCGPSAFMDAVEATAKAEGWADERIHLERFSVDADHLDLTGGAFEVVLNQSGTTVRVEPDQTIIEAMAQAGLAPLTSCEMGVCGTCVTPVLEGVPDHRDFYLNDAEKASGKLIMPCVSRCLGPRLVLDL